MSMGLGNDLPNDPPSYADVESSSELSPSSTPISSSNQSSVRPPLVQSRSSSTNVSEQKPKNVPYRPPKHLQAQIDKLGSSESSLSTFQSGTSSEYFDILPSFQMFQSILKRNDFEFDEDNLGRPPVYGDMTNSSPTPVTSHENARDIDGVLESVSSNLRQYDLSANDELNDEDIEGRYLFSDDESQDGLQSRALSPVHTPNGNLSPITSTAHAGPITHESYGHSVLDNIDMLPFAKSSPLSIDIFVTKDVPRPNMHCELETKLKEYSCGDILNGYVIITNNSEKDVDFGLFTVSLECTIKMVYTKPGTSRPMILQKKPLKMYDLNASYNEGLIPSSAGIEYKYLSRDEADGCIIGLPHNRILKGKEKYKKFVTFKFPNMLLDNACPHGVYRHTMPPPSFGIDGTAFYKRTSTIEVNKALGYGFLNIRGSPIKLKDYAFEDASVSYAIEAKFIDKLHAKDQRHPVSPNDINDPHNESNYVVSKSAQFFLRFVPDVKSQVENYSQAYNLFGKDTFDTIGINGMFYCGLAKRQTWRFIDFMNATIEQEIESALERQEFSDDDVKRKNLKIQNRTPAHENKIHLEQAEPDSHFLRAEKVRSFEKNRVLFTQTPVDILGKKKKRLLSTFRKTGEIMLCVAVPDKLLPYGAPRLISKYNDGNRDAYALSPVGSADDLNLRPMKSNMRELYNRQENTVIRDVNVELIFRSAEDDTRPPSISHVEFNVVAWSYRTDYPIPISFDHDFFYTKTNVPGAVIQEDDVGNTKENLSKLKDDINHYISFLKETKTYISQNTYSYLKGLSKLGVKKDTIRNYFEPVTSHTFDFQNEKWEGEKTDFNTVLWSKHLNVPLTVLNKGNVTLPPSFQSCLVGRVYSLQVVVKFKGGEESQNLVKIDVPLLVG